jgi:hypothetical protein
VRELMRMGDLYGIEERAARIEALGAQYAPFARQLQELAHGFQIHALTEFLKQYSEK